MRIKHSLLTTALTAGILISGQTLAHTDELMNVKPGNPIPEITTEIFKDPKSGWNLHVMTKNFKFAPKNASTKHIPGEGHGHVFVNGKKIARLYSNWFHIPQQTPGTHTITVTLNTNVHDTYAHNDKAVESIMTVEETKQKGMAHH